MPSSQATTTEWKCGDTFFHDRDGKTHLQIVLSDPTINPSRVVLVNLSSKMYHEQTCIIEPHEHPYPTKRSCIVYRFAYILPLAYLEDGEADGTVVRNEPLSAVLLDRALNGAAQSIYMPMEAWDLIDSQGLVEPF